LYNKLQAKPTVVSKIDSETNKTNKLHNTGNIDMCNLFAIRILTVFKDVRYITQSVVSALTA